MTNHTRRSSTSPLPVNGEGMGVGSQTVSIYTDGSFIRDWERGAYAALIIREEHVYELSGIVGPIRADHTAATRMELVAIVRALQFLTTPQQISLWIDHMGIYNVSQGIEPWRRAHYVDLWLAIDRQLNKHTVDWNYCVGHSGHYWNERAHHIALKTCVSGQPIRRSRPVRWYNRNWIVQEVS